MQKDIFSEKGAFGRYHKRYQNQKKDMEKDIKTEKKIQKKISLVGGNFGAVQQRNRNDMGMAQQWYRKGIGILRGIFKRYGKRYQGRKKDMAKDINFEKMIQK